MNNNKPNGIFHSPIWNDISLVRSHNMAVPDFITGTGTIAMSCDVLTQDMDMSCDLFSLTCTANRWNCHGCGEHDIKDERVSPTKSE